MDINQKITDFLDSTGWPNPDYNHDVDVIACIKDFCLYLLSEEEHVEFLIEKFSDVDLSRDIKADADGCPLIRKCFEFETLMSFHDDDDNVAFNEWWHQKGTYLFNLWLKNNK